MQFLKNLFGGGGSGLSSSPSGDSDGLYMYVRGTGCDEVVRVRINLRNDLSETDDGKGYFVHKLARGPKCPRNMDVTVHFDLRRNIVEREIDGGQYVDAAAYQAWIASQAPTEES
ncbi:MAG: hypothetical protein JNL34_05620 [Anaerolineae bacterium]|nr:hypothetical protein [Anaerolineae bacterium]